MSIEFTPLFFGLLLGIVMGTLGGGGSVMLLPVLIYLLNIPPKAAVVTSLFVVGLTSILGLFLHWRAGHVKFQTVGLFAISGICGSYFGAKAATAASDLLLLLSMGLLLFTVGIMMLVKSKRQLAVTATANPSSSSLTIVFAVGIVVGFFTGFLGVTGGFLIVPALTLVVRMPIKDAIGTSLGIIAINCGSSFIAHRNDAFDLALGLTFLLGSYSGTALGSRFADRAKSDLLSQLFGILVLLCGCLFLIDVAFYH